MAFVETHVRPACVGIEASGLLRLASMKGSPGKLNIVVPSVKKSTYFEPTTRTRLSAGLLLTEEAPCEAFCPCAWLTDEVADEAAAVEVALSVISAAVVEVAVVEAVSTSAAALDADEEGVELAESDRAITGSASVDVALVDVAVRAATMSVLKTKTVRLVTRTLATENATRLFFIPS
jgi:hypothetical protein